VTFVANFNDVALGASTALNAQFPLTRAGVRSTIVSPGRNDAGRALSLNQPDLSFSDTVLRRGTEGPGFGRAVYVRFGCAVRLAGGDSLNFVNPALPTFPSSGRPLFDLRVSAEVRRQEGKDYGGSSPVTREQWTSILSNNVYRFPSVVVGIGTDGFLRFSQGEYLASAATSFKVARTSRRAPLNRWFFLECEFGFGPDGFADGFLYCYIDGQVAAEVVDITFAADGLFDLDGLNRFDYLLSTPVEVSGFRPFGADILGWYDFGIYKQFNASPVDQLDDFFMVGLPYYPSDVGTPWGPLAASRYYPVSDGALSGSVIGGTSPAPTRWQSLLSDNGDVTRTEYAPSAADSFEMATVDVTSEIKGVSVTAKTKASDSGPNAVRLTANDGTAAESADASSEPDQYRERSATFLEKPSGGAWTAADIDGTEFGVKRVR